MAKDLSDIGSFMKRLEQTFDHPSAESMVPETLFRKLPGWTSLQSLMVVITLDEEYGVSISAEELQQAQTLADIYQLVRTKQGV